MPDGAQTPEREGARIEKFDVRLNNVCDCGTCLVDFLSRSLDSLRR